MKTLPYVYKLTHKLSGQYYFGFRCANVVPSYLDLGIKYFSSSRTIKELGFINFEIEILAEFFDKQAAYDFELSLIKEHINDPLNLNKAIKGHLCPIRKYTTDEHRKKLSLALSGKKLSEKAIKNQQQSRSKTIAAMSKEERSKKFGKGGIIAQETIAAMSKEERSKKFGVLKGKHHSEDVKQKIANKNKGKIISEETRQKMSDSAKSKIVSEETKRRISENTTGGKNPRAIKVLIFGKIYNTKKEAQIALGWNKKKLNNYLKSEDYLFTNGIPTLGQ